MTNVDSIFKSRDINGVLENDQKVFSGKEGGSKNKINSEGEWLIHSQW